MRAISGPVDNATLRAVSFGAGVQSTVLLLKAARREIGPMPDVAIFSDTKWEQKGLYQHIEWVSSEVARLTNGQLPRMVRAGVSRQAARQERVCCLSVQGQCHVAELAR